MSEYQRVITAADLLTLDQGEVTEGYSDGRAGWPEPGNNRGRSYWHGWTNGRNDRDGTHDPIAIELIKDCRRHGVWPFGPLGAPPSTAKGKAA